MKYTESDEAKEIFHIFDTKNMLLDNGTDILYGQMCVEQACMPILSTYKGKEPHEYVVEDSGMCCQRGTTKCISCPYGLGNGTFSVHKRHVPAEMDCSSKIDLPNRFVSVLLKGDDGKSLHFPAIYQEGDDKSKEVGPLQDKFLKLESISSDYSESGIQGRSFNRVNESLVLIFAFLFSYCIRRNLIHQRQFPQNLYPSIFCVFCILPVACYLVFLYASHPSLVEFVVSFFDLDLDFGHFSIASFWAWQMTMDQASIVEYCISTFLGFALACIFNLIPLDWFYDFPFGFGVYHVGFLELTDSTKVLLCLVCLKNLLARLFIGLTKSVGLLVIFIVPIILLRRGAQRLAARP